MNARKIAGFLLCESAFTKRNISSILLVALFFAVYLLAGGKVSTLPKLKETSGFGTADYMPKQELPRATGSETPVMSNEASKEVLGIVSSKERLERNDRAVNKYRAFDPDEVTEDEKGRMDPQGLVQGNSPAANRRERMAMERNERKPSDALEEIQKRLRKRSSTFSY